jgi:hypothetical protein
MKNLPDDPSVLRKQAEHDAPKFTPGPWRVRPGRMSSGAIVAGPVLQMPKGEVQEQVALATIASFMDSDSERDANAHLMAAAPDLYAICVELDRELDKQTSDEKKSHDFNAPDDAEFSVTVTAKQMRDLTRAIIKANHRAAHPEPKP